MQSIAFAIAIVIVAAAFASEDGLASDSVDKLNSDVNTVVPEEDTFSQHITKWAPVKIDQKQLLQDSEKALVGKKKTMSLEKFKKLKATHKMVDKLNKKFSCEFKKEIEEVEEFDSIMLEVEGRKKNKKSKCKLTTTYTVQLTNSQIKAYINLINTSYNGVYAKLNFDIIVKLSSGKCSSGLDVKKTRTFILASSGYFNVEASTSYKVKAQASFTGSVTMKIPVTAELYPSFVKDWKKKSSATIKKPIFTTAVDSNAWIQASAGAGIVVRALGVATAGLSAQAQMGGEAGLTLSKKGKVTMKDAQAKAALKATVSVVFSYALEFPKLPTLKEGMCAGKKINGFDPNKYMPKGIGGEKTLFSAKINFDAKKGEEVTPIPQ